MRAYQLTFPQEPSFNKSFICDSDILEVTTHTANNLTYIDILINDTPICYGIRIDSNRNVLLPFKVQAKMAQLWFMVSDNRDISWQDFSTPYVEIWFLLEER